MKMKVLLALLLGTAVSAQNKLPPESAVAENIILSQNQDNGLQMTKQDLMADGVSIILPTEIGFTEALTKLKFDNKPGLENTKAVSVILKNATQHSIVSFGLRWKIKDSTG